MPVTNLSRFNHAIAMFDALNSEDPNREASGDKDYPKELLYAYRMSEMLNRYAGDASEALQLAARCQHIQRWKIPRTDYPMTKAGYHQWRNRLKNYHAEIAKNVLSDASYDNQTIEIVCSLIRKESTFQDDAQVLEDIIVLVFLESYLEPFIAAHNHYEESKLTTILGKTFQKMSKNARTSIFSTIKLSPQLIPIVKSLTVE